MRTKDRAKFKKTAPKRLQKAVDAIRMLRKCANAETYRYAQSEAADIVDTLQDEVNWLKAAFMRGGARFTLRGEGVPEPMRGPMSRRPNLIP